MNRLIFLYVYDSDTEKLIPYFDLIIERQTIDMESRNEHEQVYAINPAKKIRIKVADRPGKVCHIHSGHKYTVWFDERNPNDAIDAISNYILNHINPVIRDSEIFLETLYKKKTAAIKLLDQKS